MDISGGVWLPNTSAEVAGSAVPILLIRGLADHNIPAHQSELIRAHNPAPVRLWQVPHAGHCGAVSVAPEGFTSRVLAWFADHSNADVFASD
jgi:pimeloyl-ACP methyl ester carboxylesterase